MNINEQTCTHNLSREHVCNSELQKPNAVETINICDRVWEKGTFRAKNEFLISGTRG